MNEPTTPPQNPYAPPQAAVREPEATSGSNHWNDAESVRREHLNVEATLKALGVFQMLAGLLVLGFSVLAALFDPSAASFLVAGIILFFASLALVGGFRLSTLSPRSRVPATVTAVWGLLLLPVGTLLAAWLLLTMYGAKGRRVLSDEYRLVVLSTPHIKYRPTPGVLLVIGAVLALVVVWLLS